MRYAVVVLGLWLAAASAASADLVAFDSYGDGGGTFFEVGWPSGQYLDRLGFAVTPTASGGISRIDTDLRDWTRPDEATVELWSDSDDLPSLLLGSWTQLAAVDGWTTTADGSVHLDAGVTYYVVVAVPQRSTGLHWFVGDRSIPTRQVSRGRQTGAWHSTGQPGFAEIPSIRIEVVPAPATAGVFGACGLLALRRRRRRSRPSRAPRWRAD